MAWTHFNEKVMTTRQNITLAIEPGLLKQARAVASSRGLSLSGLLAEKLHELIREDASFTEARKRASGLFANPLALGGILLDREAIHERRLR